MVINSRLCVSLIFVTMVMNLKGCELCLEVQMLLLKLAVLLLEVSEFKAVKEVVVEAV